MKRLDLSCLPLNLEVGEKMELIDEEGKYHLLKCIEPEINHSCYGCFFANKKCRLTVIKLNVLNRKEIKK